MAGTRINFQLAVLGAAQPVVRQHAADGVLDDPGRMLGHDLVVLDGAEPTGPTGVMDVFFLLGFFAGDGNFVRVDDDDKIPVSMLGV